MGSAESIRELAYADLHYPSEKQRNAFLSYVRLGRIAAHHGCRRILEFGSGLSTAIWGGMARRMGCWAVSVDLDFGNMQSFVAGTPHEAAVRDGVTLVQGATVSAADMEAFYLSGGRASLGGVPANAFAECIEKYYRPHAAQEKRVETAAPGSSRSTAKILVRDGELTFPVALLDAFAIGGSFQEELAFLRRATAGGLGVLDDVLAREEAWDLVFLDCGELSSNVEWEKVKPHVAVGGLAAFHDIYFPKSFKNFLVCASLTVDPAWRIVFEDGSNSLGLMVAQRVK